VPTRSRAVLSHPAPFVEARRFVKETAAASASRHVLDDAMLLTSELVTNAVRHAGHSAEDPIELTVAVDERSLRVTVRDRGPGFDPDEVEARSGEGGWGLDLVRKLSSRWGVERGELGNDVWFEIDLARPHQALTEVSVREDTGTTSAEGRPASLGEAPEDRRPVEVPPDPSRG
jgi:anti-sigma regulatory factor (Ser/Thr protein kinase)